MNENLKYIIVWNAVVFVFIYMSVRYCIFKASCVHLAEGNGRCSLSKCVLNFDSKPYDINIRLCVFYPNLGFPQSLIYQGLVITYSLLSPRTPNAKPLYILLYLHGVCKHV